MSSSSPSNHGETHGMDGPDCSSLAVPRLPDDALVEILSRLRASEPRRSADPSASPNPGATSSPTASAARISPNRCKGSSTSTSGSREGGDGSSVGAADVNGGDLASSRDGMLLRHGNWHFINLLGKTMPFLDRSFTFLKEQPGIQAIELLDSCNGLLLFGHRQVSDTFDSLGYIVCNPVTEQWVAVPSTGWTPTPPEEIVDEREKAVRTFLIFDPSVSLHFELVQFWQDEMAEDVEAVHIYSSGTGFWSDRLSLLSCEGGWGNWGGYGAIEKPRYGRAFVNGMLHFLNYNPWQDMYEVVAVDGQAKKCRVIHWPDRHPFPQAAFIGQSQGLLHCISELVEGSGFRSPGLSIWALEDYNTEEWVLKHSLSLWQLFERIEPLFISHYYIVGLHTDCNLIFFAQCSDQKSGDCQKLIAYDVDSRQVHVLCTLGHGSRYITPYVPSLKSL